MPLKDGWVRARDILCRATAAAKDIPDPNSKTPGDKIQVILLQDVEKILEASMREG